MKKEPKKVKNTKKCFPTQQSEKHRTHTDGVCATVTDSLKKWRADSQEWRIANYPTLLFMKKHEQLPPKKQEAVGY